MPESDFYTLKGYQLHSQTAMTYSMEDYLEMICRLSQEGGHVRMNLLAGKLNVRPSSASKMVGNLKKLDLVEFERYSIIRLTPQGKEVGEYLLYRHDILNNFLCHINNAEDETEQVEKIEHYLNRLTIENIRRATELLKEQ